MTWMEWYNSLAKPVARTTPRLFKTLLPSPAFLLSKM